ncbi:MAG: UDP-N-acetylglucosamine--N-acetylmuramyl-(pentapeptide) pyrophosphoryl-undecaprenol N-acetylglucosamine transferase [Armatimonadota bacterium]
MRVLFAGGGTSGHLSPCLAVAQTLKTGVPDATAAFVVSKKPGEAQMVRERGFEAFPISGSGMPYGLSLKAVGSFFRLAAGGMQALGIMKRFDPDAVFATGGFVSAAVVPAAAIRGCATMIHASDARPDRTNRLLSRWADRISTVSDGAAEILGDRAVVTGQPVRPEIMQADRGSARETLGIPNDAFVLLVTGGSQGAQKLNDATVEALPRLLTDPEFHIIHLTGRGKLPDLEAIRGSDAWTEHYHVQERRDDMATVLAAADLILTRAGASSLAEAAAWGRPMIVVPYPHAGGHQRYNAEIYEAADAAIVVDDDNMNADRLVETVRALRADTQRYQAMARASAEVGSHNAARRIVEYIVELAGTAE